MWDRTPARLMMMEHGYKIVGIAEKEGGLCNPNGIDIHQLTEYKNRNETTLGFRGAEAIPSEELLVSDCDILIPAATENVITSRNADRIKARVIVEGANGPTTAVADEILAEKRVFVVPDILANSGGVTASYFEWVQDRPGLLLERGHRQRAARNHPARQLRRRGALCRKPTTSTIASQPICWPSIALPSPSSSAAFTRSWSNPGKSGSLLRPVSFGVTGSMSKTVWTVIRHGLRQPGCYAPTKSHTRAVKSSSCNCAHCCTSARIHSTASAGDMPAVFSSAASERFLPQTTARERFSLPEVHRCRAEAGRQSSSCRDFSVYVASSAAASSRPFSATSSTAPPRNRSIEGCPAARIAQFPRLGIEIRIGRRHILPPACFRTMPHSFPPTALPADLRGHAARLPTFFTIEAISAAGTPCPETSAIQQARMARIRR